MTEASCSTGITITRRLPTASTAWFETMIGGQLRHQPRRVAPGHIETGKTEGARRTEAKPETKAIPDDPGETIDMDLELKQSEPSRKS